jgi:ferrous iron transport protein B
MSTIYSVGDEDNFDQLREKMNKDRHKNGEPVYSLAVILSLMVFYAFAMQCMSTLAVVYKETRSWKWPMIQFGYMTVLAYFGSWVVFSLFS